MIDFTVFLITKDGVKNVSDEFNNPVDATNK